LHFEPNQPAGMSRRLGHPGPGGATGGYRSAGADAERRVRTNT